jgi:hypothetical protein
MDEDLFEDMMEDLLRDYKASCIPIVTLVSRTYYEKYLKDNPDYKLLDAAGEEVNENT